jgi:ATP-dependent Clp protease ATP-binding subunit ClpA
MDHGTLTDNNGKKADFRNVALIMTSNAGAREMSANPIGFGGKDPGNPRMAVERTFSPEFRNRLDAVITFNALTEPVMLRVVDKFMEELQQRLDEKKVFLTLSARARKHLAHHGYDPVFGARPLARLIQTEIGDVIAAEILFGRLSKGGMVTVGMKSGKLTFLYK